MLKQNTDIIFKVLETLFDLSDRGTQIYRLYLEDEKKYRYAKMLKENNEKILLFLLEHKHVLPCKQQTYVSAWINHIDVWRSLWEETDHQTHYDLDSPFVFESRVQFPHAELAALRADYLAMRELI